MTEDLLKQARILVLDDDVSTLCLLRSVLERFGFSNVRTLEHPRTFGANFHEFQPDVVITDLIMPEMDGFAVIDFVRGVLPPDAWLPVLVCTANDSAQSRRRALAAGATDILVKPLDPSELLMRIRHVVRTSFLHHTLAGQNTALEGIVRARTRDLEKALSELKDSQRAVVQQERFRAFGEMASGIVHDFNNALMTVIGYSELMLGDPVSIADVDQVKDYLGAINTAGRDASHIVSRLREFYRPREKSDQFGGVDLNKIVEEAVKLTQPKWKTLAQNLGRNISVEFELEKIPPVLGHEPDLREIVTNLIFNAVDAMPEGGIITMRSRAKGDRAILEVADCGTGMPPEVRQRCLEPFFTTKGERGTGLGLAMVFGVIKRHDGELEIDSTPGKGTTMVISLPVCDEVGLTSRIEVPRAPLKPLDVLLVDDEPSVRDVLLKYLSSDGHRVVTAAGGAEAVRTFQQQQFDLLVTDQSMPGMSGVQLARFVRRMRSNQPIILLTGFSFDTDHIPPEISKVVRKPIAPDKLRAVLAEVVAP
jgi:signal transduction histidine kinase